MMQWILQEFDDTRKLAEALDQLDVPTRGTRSFPS